MKLCSLKWLRCNGAHVSLVKSWNLNLSFEFLRCVVAKMSLVTGFLLTESPRWKCFAPWKNMTAKSWKTNFKMDALLESKVATRWSVVNHESRTVRSFYNAWQRKGVWVAGSQKAVTAALDLRVAKTWGVAASKKKQRWLVKLWKLDRAIVLQCVAAQRHLGRGFSKGHHGGNSSFCGENLRCCSSQRDGDEV